MGRGYCGTFDSGGAFGAGSRSLVWVGILSLASPAADASQLGNHCSVRNSPGPFRGRSSLDREWLVSAEISGGNRSWKEMENALVARGRGRRHSHVRRGDLFDRRRPPNELVGHLA